MTIVRVPQFSSAPGATFGTTSPSAAVPSTPASPDAWYKWLGAVLLVVGVLGGLAIAQAVKPPVLALEPGIGMFAVFFIVAQTIERLLEVLQLLFPRIGSTPDSAKKRAAHFTDPRLQAGIEAKLVAARKQTFLGPSIDKEGARHTMARAMADATNNADDVSLQVAAEAKSVVETIEMNRSLLSWSLASCLAMMGSAALGLYLIDTIVTSAAPPKVIDLMVTGLVIGAGTKPLHDLIKNIESSKKAEEDA